MSLLLLFTHGTINSTFESDDRACGEDNGLLEGREGGRELCSTGGALRLYHTIDTAVVLVVGETTTVVRETNDT